MAGCFRSLAGGFGLWVGYAPVGSLRKESGDASGVVLLLSRKLAAILPLVELMVALGARAVLFGRWCNRLECSRMFQSGVPKSTPCIDRNRVRSLLAYFVLYFFSDSRRVPTDPLRTTTRSTPSLSSSLLPSSSRKRLSSSSRRSLVICSSNHRSSSSSRCPCSNFRCRAKHPRQQGRLRPPRHPPLRFTAG